MEKPGYKNYVKFLLVQLLISDHPFASLSLVEALGSLSFKATATEENYVVNEHAQKFESEVTVTHFVLE